MNKAVENNYLVNNKEKNNKKKKKPKIEEENFNNDNIKYGYCNLKIFDKYENIYHMSLVENEFGKIKLNTDMESKEEYLKNENYLVNNLFKNVFVVKIKNEVIKEDNYFLVNNYEIANLFKNDEFNLNVVKIDFDTFFVEFSSSENNDNSYNIEANIKKIINFSKNKNNDNNIKNEKLNVEEIYNYKDYIKNLNIY